MARVICAGHVNWDVTLRVDRLPAADGEARIETQRQGGGGSASNVAAVLAQLGVDVHVLGSVGDDEHGLLARRELEAFGVETTLTVVDGEETTVKYLVVDGDGDVMVLGNEGANEAFEADDLSADDIGRATHLHLTGQRPETAERLARRAEDAGLRVSFAPGRRVADRDFRDVRERADRLFLNDREVATLTDDPDTTARETGRTLVVTRGNGGAVAYTPTGPVEHDGFEVDPVDTTGAGDAFAAAYLAARFDRGVAESLAVANACGAIAATTMGARTTLTWSEVDDYVPDSES